MAKRFTDTDKWKKPLLRSLQAPYKLLWLYILDDCDHAGIWHVDLEVASIRIGHQIELRDIKEKFNGHVVFFDNDEKMFLPAFIEFQYGTLNESNRVHQSVLSLLEKYELSKFKDLISPLQGTKDKDKDKDMDKDEKEKPKKKEKDQFDYMAVFPFKSSEAMKAVADYRVHRSQMNVRKFTPVGWTQACKEWASWGEASFIEAVYHSISKNYQGLFQVNKSNSNGYNNQRTNGRIEPAPHGTEFGSFNVNT
jgi:hypothetical protein